MMKYFPGIWIALCGIAFSAITLLAVELNATEATKEPAATGTISSAAAEVVRLLNAGVKQEVLLGYIGNSTNRFSLNADDLIYLHEHGVSAVVTTAMLERDQVLTRASGAAASQTAPATTISPDPDPSHQSPAIPTISESQPAVAQFYEALVPYGTWMQLPDRGWVWQPREAAINSEWRPYVDGGRWAWTDHGWYWASDYPWGWACFHYGRWLQLETIGWVWFPDTIWAPSWVTWRQHDDYVGWAPLPPNAFDDRRVTVEPVVSNYDFGLPQHTYTFVNVEYVFLPNIRSRCLPQPKVVEFYRHCKVVNDFGPGKHRGVVNRGIAVDRVSAATGKHLSPVPVYKGGVHAGGFATTPKKSAWAVAGPSHQAGEPALDRRPGFSRTMPVREENRSAGNQGSGFALPAAPRLSTASGSHSSERAPTPHSGIVAAPMNPVVSPMQPITPPMQPATPPVNPAPSPIGSHRLPPQKSPGIYTKPFAPVAPEQAHAPVQANPASHAHPGHQRRTAQFAYPRQHLQAVAPAAPAIRASQLPAAPPAAPPVSAHAQKQLEKKRP